MQRRDFLKTGLAAGGASLVSGCGGTSDEKAPPAAVEASAAPADRWSVPAFEHDESTVAQLQQAQSEGRLSARALAESYLARMDAVDAAGPRLNSVIERNPDALAIADELDRERKERGARGPLAWRSRSSSSAMASASGLRSITELRRGPEESMASMRAK